MEVGPRDTTPPPLQAPTAKEKKYDRQLRLWAASGQRALEESHALVVVGEGSGSGSGSNSSVAGVETLKNLILPSIGSFTIADSATVTEADLGVNFFLEVDSLGKSRAEESRRLLQELNPDVSGHAISHRLEGWPRSPDDLRPYNLIMLCAPVAAELCGKICSYAESHCIPVIYIHSAGFYSAFSLQLPPEFPIVDTHPDPDSTQDLRLLAPWPELSATVTSLGGLRTLDDHDHGHIPYIVLLLYYLEVWKVSHNGKPPDTFKEKTQFRDLIRAGARIDNAEGGEENYDEACAAVLKTITPPAVGAGCREMFEMSSCKNLRPNSANFWIIANAVKTFYESHGVLPLPGSIPDMKAKSADYIKLQNIYKSKARRDVAEVLSTVRTIERGMSNDRIPVPEAEIEAFCKNASHIQVLQGTSLPQRRLDRPESVRNFQRILESSGALAIFMALTATTNKQSQSDSLDFFSAVSKGASEDALTRLRKVMEEVRRTQGAELHNISSFTGGMVAQEAIKLLTRQYVPVHNTCIFDGISSTTEVLKL